MKREQLTGSIDFKNTELSLLHRMSPILNRNIWSCWVTQRLATISTRASSFLLARCFLYFFIFFVYFIYFIGFRVPYIFLFYGYIDLVVRWGNQNTRVVIVNVYRSHGHWLIDLFLFSLFSLLFFCCCFLVVVSVCVFLSHEPRLMMESGDKTWRYR